MRTLALAVGVLCAAWPGYGAQKAPDTTLSHSTSACSYTADDVAIYSAAIRETLLKDADGDESVVVEAQTSTGFPSGMAAWTSFGANQRKDLMDAADAATKSDFGAKAHLHCDLPKTIEPTGRVVFVDAKQQEPLFPTGARDWKEFNRKYPQAHSFALFVAGCIQRPA